VKPSSPPGYQLRTASVLSPSSLGTTPLPSDKTGTALIILVYLQVPISGIFTGTNNCLIEKYLYVDSREAPKLFLECSNAVSADATQCIMIAARCADQHLVTDPSPTNLTGFRAEAPLPEMRSMYLTIQFLAFSTAELQRAAHEPLALIVNHGGYIDKHFSNSGILIGAGPPGWWAALPAGSYASLLRAAALLVALRPLLRAPFLSALGPARVVGRPFCAAFLSMVAPHSTHS
jgi:hypothetical protein